MSNLSVFCLFLCARTRLEVELHFKNFLGVLVRLIFQEIKIGRFVRAGKTTAMENGPKAGLQLSKMGSSWPNKDENWLVFRMLGRILPVRWKHFRLFDVTISLILLAMCVVFVCSTIK